MDTLWAQGIGRKRYHAARRFSLNQVIPRFDPLRILHDQPWRIGVTYASRLTLVGWSREPETRGFGNRAGIRKCSGLVVLSRGPRNPSVEYPKNVTHEQC